MPFDSPDMNLGTLLADVGHGRIQLPDFQREWKWDDPRIASLLATITLGYPVGVVMMLETGGPDVNFAPKPLAGVPSSGLVPPESLLLDGQQRLTSLYQSLKSQRPVDTADPRGKKLQRWYFVDIDQSLGDDGDREEAIRSVPADLVVREDFGRTVIADYSTTEAQCAAGMFPLSLAFDMPEVFRWAGIYTSSDTARVQRWNDFYQRVLQNVIAYTVPVIVLKKSTPKEAVCTVFEKVNTGGVPLNVFELLTATFAGDKARPDFRLNDDWRARRDRLRVKPVLRSLENTDFLQCVTLLASLARRDAHLARGGDAAQAPGVTCKRRDILRLKLDEYLTFAPRAEEAFLWAAGFMAQQHIFRSEDLPYRTQLVPLAAIRAVLGPTADTHSVDGALRRWYWSGVLGELYGSTTETRFARDVEQVVPWSQGKGQEPITVSEAGFQAGRLLTMRTRNSAAYKGLYALLMQAGCMDWMHSQPMNIASFLDLAVDIHHIFPKAWCDKNGIDTDRRESIINKTALSARTNRKIGGRSPAAYLPLVEAESGLSPTEIDKIVSTHLIESDALRSADFDRFFAARRAALLELVSTAMGKPVSDVEAVDETAAAYEETDSEPDDTVSDIAEGSVDQTITEASADDRGAGGHQEAASVPSTRLAEGHLTDPDPGGLERTFHQAMVDVYRRARTEAGYNATVFLTMVSQRGGLETARTLLNAAKPSDGFRALWERQRLDLTMETVVLRPTFASLFTDEERERARSRLAEYGYRPDPLE
jgi:hypothetical protein